MKTKEVVCQLINKYLFVKDAGSRVGILIVAMIIAGLVDILLISYKKANDDCFLNHCGSLAVNLIIFGATIVTCVSIGLFGGLTYNCYKMWTKNK